MPERSATLVAQSVLPAGGRVFGESLRLTVLPPRTVVVLKLSARALDAIAAIRVAGRRLPHAQNRWQGEDPVVCRIAPDTWWFVSATHEAADIADAIRQDGAARPCAVTDISDACSILAIEGSQAVAVLARGCALDFAAAAFPADACTRTRVAQLAVVLRRTSPERFEIIADRSQVAWLSGWVEDAVAGMELG